MGKRTRDQEVVEKVVKEFKTKKKLAKKTAENVQLSDDLKATLQWAHLECEAISKAIKSHTYLRINFPSEAWRHFFIEANYLPTKRMTKYEWVLMFPEHVEALIKDFNAAIEAEKEKPKSDGQDGKSQNQSDGVVSQVGGIQNHASTAGKQ